MWLNLYGKQEARPILTKEKVAQNCEAIGRQLRRFLPYDNVIMANNIDWLGEMKYLDFLRDIGSKFSVNKMLTAESVKLRMETGITFMEFSYMLLQSYDYYILNRDYGREEDDLHEGCLLLDQSLHRRLPSR